MPFFHSILHGFFMCRRTRVPCNPSVCWLNRSTWNTELMIIKICRKNTSFGSECSFCCPLEQCLLQNELNFIEFAKCCNRQLDERKRRIMEEKMRCNKVVRRSNYSYNRLSNGSNTSCWKNTDSTLYGLEIFNQFNNVYIAPGFMERMRQANKRNYLEGELQTLVKIDCCCNDRTTEQLYIGLNHECKQNLLNDRIHKRSTVRCDSWFNNCKCNVMLNSFFRHKYPVQVAAIQLWQFNYGGRMQNQLERLIGAIAVEQNRINRIIIKSLMNQML